MSAASTAVDRALDLLVVPGFSSLGFRAREAGWSEPAADPERLSGRIVLVTGATGGLGLETAAELAGAGAEVWLIGRNPARLMDARDRVRVRSDSDDVHTDVCDLSLMSSVVEFAERFLATRGEADVLINNAAVLPGERERTKEGFELAFATNLLGPFLLTNLLVPALSGREDARIINVVSGGLYTARLDVDDLELDDRPYDGARVYAHTKRALLILTGIWHERLAADGISVHASHPGWADTPGVASSLPGFHRVVGPILRDAAQGADTTVWLSWCEQALEHGGELWHDRVTRPHHRVPWTRESAGERARLWEELMRMASHWGYDGRPLAPAEVS